jgi:hypothetical protein
LNLRPSGYWPHLRYQYVTSVGEGLANTMFTYKEQLEMLDPVRVREDETKRIDCPFCGGRKTLGITNRDGSKVWNCFKASCGIRGSTGSPMSSNTIRRRLDKVAPEPLSNIVPIPQHLSHPDNHPAAIEYLKSVNSWEPFKQGLVDIKYAPADKRVLFMFPENRGAVGRSLIGRKPKWKNYGDTTGLFRVGTGNTAVVVEDAASATFLGMFLNCSGCALLGTNLSSLQRAQLCAFDEVLIALDKDATRKSVKLKSKLEGRVNVKVIRLIEDIKNMSFNTVERILQRT